ncbi:angiogenin-1-like isoform X2 [Scomber scombrus]|uniref:Angiogenin-1-like isoform X2 n=1 Tax=Scomber scombrus TaxID=13677 RepID=A0AAV1Q2B6_SCOSC
MRIQFACLLLVLLCATGHAKFLGFNKKHVRQQMFQCGGEMEEINEIDPSACVGEHLFVISDEASVKAVCNGNKGAAAIKSPKTFQMIKCTRKKGGSCFYNMEKIANAHIKVSCSDGTPLDVTLA